MEQEAITGSVMDEFDFTINYDNIIQHKDCLPVTRLLAADLKANPYMTVGKFVHDLSDIDLGTLNTIAQRNITLPDDLEDLENDPPFNEEDIDPLMADIVLIAEMPSRAEGVISESDRDLARTTSMFMYYVMFESLYRKGLIKLHHKNMTFSEDSKHKMIVEKL